MAVWSTSGAFTPLSRRDRRDRETQVALVAGSGGRTAIGAAEINRVQDHAAGMRILERRS